MSSLVSISAHKHIYSIIHSYTHTLSLSQLTSTSKGFTEFDFCCFFFLFTFFLFFALFFILFIFWDCKHRNGRMCVYQRERKREGDGEKNVLRRFPTLNPFFYFTLFHFIFFLSSLHSFAHFILSNCIVWKASKIQY